MKNGKLRKILGELLDGIIGGIPLGSTVKKVLTGGVKKGVFQLFDRNNDGKITVSDFKPFEIIGGLLVLSFLVSKGIIDIQVLKEIVKIFGL